MLLTISTINKPASDLGYLLHKNPANIQSFPIAFGKAHVFYPEVTEDRTTVALLLDIDSLELMKRRRSRGNFVESYINDRPYVASSFLSVAIAKVFGSALNGTSKERSELAGKNIPLEAKVTVVKSKNGEKLLRSLFEPLGYIVEVQSYTLDNKFPEWGESPYYTLTLQATVRLQDLLTHLYVLLPVLDNEKHYHIDEEEVQKLLHRGKGWLEKHPEKELITKRYLKHQKHLTTEALAQLTEGELGDPEVLETNKPNPEEKIEQSIHLNEKRLEAVISKLQENNVKTVLDLGCGEGKLLKQLLENKEITKISGMDVAFSELEKAKKRLHFDDMPDMQKKRIELFQGSLTYRDSRFEGCDAITLMEVIEHIDVERLPVFEKIIFGYAKPKLIIVTTPNKEYNNKFENLLEDQLRHKDHRFEWTREQFQSWANNAAKKYGYTVSFSSVGEEDDKVGSPTQMGVFSL